MRSLQTLFLASMVLFALPREGLGASGLQARERAAKRACLNGDPAKGVAILTELFIDTNDVTYLFNQGRCFEQNRLYEDAIGRFREYVVKGDKLTEKDKAEVEAHIARCQSYLSKSEPPKPPVVEAPRPAAPVEQAPPSPSVVEQAVPAAIVTQPEARPPDRKAGAGMRLGGIVVAALGVAGVATGVILNLKANQMSSDLEKPDNYSRRTESSRNTYETLGWVSYGLGAACLVTGSLLYYLGWRSAAVSSTPVAWAPTISPDMAGVAVEGSF